ncbi:MAG TPA: hypothetical protein VK066_03520 [Chloroflexota bacterium]|nr:hypothetical protein [Chloroflexota bacterium]
MESQSASQIREGMCVCDRLGNAVGTVSEVHREPPAGSMAPGIGYLVIQAERPDRLEELHVPLTQVLGVQGDHVVAEINPEMVAAHDAQWIAQQPPR